MKNKIYEQLNYLPFANEKYAYIDWVVQNQIAATNGVHYKDRIGKLKTIPKYKLPNFIKNRTGLMLDIGSGWGRWLRAGDALGLLPVGIDIRLEFCKTQQEYLKSLNIKGYSVVADLEEIPFKDGIFDLVWSFSVIQHTHKLRLQNCLKHINRVLTNNGITVLEFPIKTGLRNRFAHRKLIKETEPDYNSWDVRYYTLAEYKEIFGKFLNYKKSTIHSVIGIGILPEDIKYVSFKFIPLVFFSNMLTFLFKSFNVLHNLADSLYFSAMKKSLTDELNLDDFLELHNLKYDNLNIIKLMKCPASGFDMILDDSRTKILVPEARIFYPVVDNIPIIIKSEAVRY